MSLDPIFDHVSQNFPLSAMARATLSWVFRDEQVDRLFERHAKRQYEGELAFSALVNLMLVVSCRVRPSVNAAFKNHGHEIGVSVTSIYNKLKGIEPEVTRALVRETARDMNDLLNQWERPRAKYFSDYAIRILDGSHLEGSHHRINATRASSAAPLPGVGLVVLEPVRRLVLDYIPCEDAYEQERVLLPLVFDQLEAGQVWIADRSFCTSGFVRQLQACGASFVIRKHATNVVIEPCGAEKSTGSSETGEVFEQPVEILDDVGGRFRGRRIRIVLEKKTRDGDTELVILSNLPEEVSAQEIAQGYRQRWTIESAFGEIRKCLNGEINALGYPKAALFSFGLALTSFNLLSVITGAIGAAHGAQAAANFSTQQAAQEIHYAWATTTALPNKTIWVDRYGSVSAPVMAAELVKLAQHLDIKRFSKYPTRARSPSPKRVHDPRRPHVSTARLLEGRK